MVDVLIWFVDCRDSGCDYIYSTVWIIIRIGVDRDKGLGLGLTWGASTQDMELDNFICGLNN